MAGALEGEVPLPYRRLGPPELQVIACQGVAGHLAFHCSTPCMSTDVPRSFERDQWFQLGTLVSLLALLIWSHWNSLALTASYWEEPQYSHGYLIPLFAVALLWMRKRPLEEPTLWSRLSGIVIVAAAMGVRLVATIYQSVTLEMVSFVPCVFGLFVFVAGWQAMRWAGPAIGFLLFMYPVPPLLFQGLSTTLQEFATAATTYSLQTLGVPSYSEGNVIHISELRLGVVEACSGLRMLTIFIAMAVAIAMVIERPRLDRIIIVLSALPIAVAVNAIRITVTGLLYLMAERGSWVTMEMAETFFHDVAGWVMMPMALAMLFVEIKILDWLFIPDPSCDPFAKEDALALDG